MLPSSRKKNCSLVLERKPSRSRACPGPVPGPRRAPAQTRQTRRRKGREGKGREGKEGKKGRKEGGKEQACGAERSGPAARMDGWIDGQGREESKRLSGGRERRAAGKIRRGNGTKESHGQQWLVFVLLIAHDMVKQT